LEESFAPSSWVPADGVAPAEEESHGFHLIMSIIAVGLWVAVWIIVTISNSIENAK
jgi:hypothetical protein